MDFEKLKEYLDQIENEIVFDIKEIDVKQSLFSASPVFTIDNRADNKSDDIIERSVK